MSKPIIIKQKHTSNCNQKSIGKSILSLDKTQEVQIKFHSAKELTTRKTIRVTA